VRVRHQLPAYSPISRRAVGDAAIQLLTTSADPRPHLRALIQEQYGAARVLLYGSGTQALTAALREACGRIVRPATVALPAFSCFDVASAAVGANCKVSFYDIDPDSLGPDMKSLERVISAGSRIVVIASLYGLPVDWSAVADLKARYGFITVEDAAQGRGGFWRGQQLGSLGDLSTISFLRAKGWTGGSGGALLSHGPIKHLEDPIEATAADETAAVVVVLAQYALARPSIYGLPRAVPALRLGQTVYRQPRPLRSLARAAASALLSTRSEAADEDEIRRENASLWVDAIEQCAFVHAPYVHRDDRGGFIRFPIRVTDGMNGLGDAAELVRLGIAPSYPAPLPTLREIFSQREGPDSSWPGACTLARELVTLPTHSKLRRSELQHIARVLCS